MSASPMNFRHIRHIAAKDAQRLLWVVALTLALLARFAHQDAWRSAGMPGPEEGWLNILLPLAWSFLIGMLILEEAPTGDTQFWLTLPCPRSTWIVAKASFVLLAVHLPYLVVCWWIVGARGFQPVQHLDILLYRQCALLALTLTATALAALAGNISRFLMLAVFLAAIAGAPATQPRDSSLQPVREVMEFCIVTIGAVIAIAVQYGRYRRVIGWSSIAVSLIAAGIIWQLPRDSFMNIQAAVSPAPATLSVHLGTRTKPPEGIGSAIGPIAIPIEVAGLSRDLDARLEPVALSLTDPEGREYRLGTDLNMRYCCDGESTSWLALFAPRVLNRILDVPLTLRARALAWTSTRQESQRLRVGTNVIAAQRRCSAEVTGEREEFRLLQVACESPGARADTYIRVVDPTTGRSWNRSLYDGQWFATYPTSTWLSPMEIGSVNFKLTDEATYASSPGAHWMVPREVLSSAVVETEPESPAGTAVIDYEIPNIRLSQYLVNPLQ